MKRFKSDFKKYFAYAKFSARSDLKSEVASSYLNWLWWVLDPMLFMLVYTFIARLYLEVMYSIFLFLYL